MRFGGFSNSLTKQTGKKQACEGLRTVVDPALWVRKRPFLTLHQGLLWEFTSRTDVCALRRHSEKHGQLS